MSHRQQPTRAQYRHAIADAIVIEHTAQERTRDLDKRRAFAVTWGDDREAEQLRAEMDALLADAAERMADRLREVHRDA